MVVCSLEVGELFSSLIASGIGSLACSSAWAWLSRDVDVDERLAIRSAELVEQSSLEYNRMQKSGYYGGLLLLRWSVDGGLILAGVVATLSLLSLWKKEGGAVPAIGAQGEWDEATFCSARVKHN